MRDHVVFVIINYRVYGQSPFYSNIEFSRVKGGLRMDRNSACRISHNSEWASRHETNEIPRHLATPT